VVTVQLAALRQLHSPVRRLWSWPSSAST